MADIHNNMPARADNIEHKTTVERLLTEISYLQRECRRLNDEVRRLRSRTTLAKKTYDSDDIQHLEYWFRNLNRKEPPPLKRFGRAPNIPGIDFYVPVLPRFLHMVPPLKQVAPAPAPVIGSTQDSEERAGGLVSGGAQLDDDAYARAHAADGNNATAGGAQI